MPSVAEVNRWSEAGVALGWAVVWQSTLLAAAVAVLARHLARSSPGVRYWLWQVVAFKLLLMPAWTVAVPIRSEREPASRAEGRPAPGPILPGPVEPIPATVTAPGPVGSPPMAVGEGASIGSGLREVSWRAWLILAWLTLVVARMAQLAGQWRRLSALLRGSRPLDDPTLQGLVADASARLGLRSVPRVLVVAASGSPFVVGAHRPTMVLPAPLLDALDIARWRPVILHELAHIRRGDLIWGWIPELAERLYPFHPVAYWAAYQARLERELACDALALEHGDLDAPGYAMTLVDVVGLAARAPARVEDPTPIPSPLVANAKEAFR